jgi:hypothetical protein
MAAVTKKLDSKGRLILGPEFANATVLVEKVSDGEFVVKAAVVVPVNEAWLFKNREALSLVQTGIAQAKAGELTKTKKEDLSWIDKLKD